MRENRNYLIKWPRDWTKVEIKPLHNEGWMGTITTNEMVILFMPLGSQQENETNRNKIWLVEMDCTSRIRGWEQRKLCDPRKVKTKTKQLGQPCGNQNHKV